MTPSRSRTLRFLALAGLLISSGSAVGQALPPPKEVRVSGLPSLMARTQEVSDVLLTSLDTIFHDRSVCCGKDSALEDSAARADPSSLKDVATKLQGRHLLSDGRPIVVKAEYMEPSAINFSALIGTFREKHALLMEWNSHLYVVYGVAYYETMDYETGTITDAIQKILLLDTRYSDSRRTVTFERGTDDWGKVQGLVYLAVDPS